jgi:hypothetical protein
MSNLSYLRKFVFIWPIALARALGFALALSINWSGFIPPGQEQGDLFVAECPYCHNRKQLPLGGFVCSCKERFVIALCNCNSRHAAVSIQDEGWYCPTKGKWLWARLCPQCRMLAEASPSGRYQCALGHEEFRMGRCERCRWLAGEHPDHYLLCEFCGHHTVLKGS